MTDDEFAKLGPIERDFAVRWTRMTAEEQDWFRDSLLAAFAVLQRLGVIDPPSPEEQAAA